MSKKRNTRVKSLHIVLVIYIMLFSVWWTYLLLSKNDDAYNTRIELLKAEMKGENSYNESTFESTAMYKDLVKKKISQRRMIFAEAMVYFVILLIGVWLVYRSFRQEIILAKQQRNFLLSITHELKSPIASIRLALDTLLKRAEMLKPEMVQKLSRNGISEAERLHDLVNNILLAARLDSGLQLTPGDVDLEHFLSKRIAQLQSKYPAVNFNLNTIGNIPTIQADENALTSISLNLMENAVKYCPNGCTIDVHLQTKNNHLILEVADKGIGIPDEEKPKIFQKFYRVGSEDTRKTKGTGLGLYIVKSLVEVHKGNISVRDNQPKGSIFSVELPLAN